MNNKQYIIPTNKWLVPLHKLISDDISTKGLLMLSKYMDKHEVVVKITKNTNYERIKKINDIVRKYNNFAKTITVLKCDENDINLETEYKNIKGFCLSDEYNTQIVLEIMKKYSGSLNEYVNKLNLDIVKLILQQLLLSQLEVFEKHAFIHMDIHLGNILINHKNTTLNYNIHKHNHSIITNNIFILSDYDRSILLTLENTPQYNPNNIFVSNLMKTFKSCFSLLDVDKIKYLQIVDKYYNDNNEYMETERSILRTLYRRTRDQEGYIEEVIENAEKFIDNIWHEVFNEHMFSHFIL